MTTLITLEQAKPFFDYAKERQQIKINRDQGLPKPWTADPILQNYRFCNVYREDDVVTKFIRKNITPEKYGEAFVGAMVIARWFNRVETIQEMIRLGEYDLLRSWTIDLDVWSQMMRKRLGNLKPIITGAYIIKTPNGMDKLHGLIWSMRQILPHAIELQNYFGAETMTLQRATELLSEYPYLGPFMAYEVVTDLRWSVLSHASDINLWANPGPGAARGLSRLLGYAPDFFNRGSKKDVEVMMLHMRELLRFAHQPENWDPSLPKWEMREVEHTLCEVDKYLRVKNSEGTPKQLYKGAK